MAAGIEVRKGKRGTKYRASVWSPKDDKLIKRSFASLPAAKTWRVDAQSALQRGKLRAPTPITVEDAAKAWLTGAEGGTILNRAGDRYKPSAVRSYERALRLRVYPVIGRMRLTEVRRIDLQDLIDNLVAKGLSPSTVGCSVLPLRAIFRRASNRGEVGENPTTGLYLPAVRGGRDRIVTPAEAKRLIAALPEGRDRALWATAFYGGLRRGELRALRVRHVDLPAGVIHVDHGWDDKEGEITTKGRNRRQVPIAAELRTHLTAHMLASGRRGGDLLFGESKVSPFDTRHLTRRADQAWAQAKLERVTLHECRHCCASFLIEANVNIKQLATYMGHADVRTTLNKYGHLLPGNEQEAAGLLDAYLARTPATTQA